jgi:hypothetical protein
VPWRLQPEPRADHCTTGDRTRQTAAYIPPDRTTWNHREIRLDLLGPADWIPYPCCLRHGLSSPPVRTPYRLDRMGCKRDIADRMGCKRDIADRMGCKRDIAPLDLRDGGPTTLILTVAQGPSQTSD